MLRIATLSAPGTGVRYLSTGPGSPSTLPICL
jgi:hypothetical protein